MSTNFLHHFTKIQQIAEMAINGPSTIKYDTATWKCLGLYKQFYPRMFGQIESRIVYADVESDQALLRYTYWNPDEVREELKAAYRSGQTPTLSSPMVFFCCVTIDLKWLSHAIKKWSTVEVPVKPLSFPEKIDLDISKKNGFTLNENHRVRLEWTDLTVLEVSWNLNGTGTYNLLNQTWNQLWEELGSFLRTNEKIEVEEKWPFNLPLSYSPFPQ